MGLVLFFVPNATFTRNGSTSNQHADKQRRPRVPPVGRELYYIAQYVRDVSSASMHAGYLRIALLRGYMPSDYINLAFC